MKIIQLVDPVYDYLLHVIEAHGARGIHPDEGMAINRLWDAVKNHATNLSDAEIQKMTSPKPTAHVAGCNGTPCTCSDIILGVQAE